MFEHTPGVQRYIRSSLRRIHGECKVLARIVCSASVDNYPSICETTNNVCAVSTAFGACFFVRGVAASSIPGLFGGDTFREQEGREGTFIRDFYSRFCCFWCGALSQSTPSNRVASSRLPIKWHLNEAGDEMSFSSASDTRLSS